MDQGRVKVNLIHSLVSAGIVLIMFTAVLVVSKAYPFGDNTFLMYDMKRQYIDYYAYLKSVYSGENNIFYSFSTALGAGMVGFFTYYLNSPYLLILNLFKEAYLPCAVTLIIVLKLMTAAFVMDIFLQKYLNLSVENFSLNKETLTVYLGSISWAMSSFLFAHSMNSMWIDVVLMLPVVIYNLEKLLRRGKIFGYIASICAILLLNYYISYMVFIFIGLWTLYRFFTERFEHRIKLLIKVVLTTLLSVGIDAVFLVPTALELFNSPKDITQLGLKLEGKNLIIRDVLSKLPTLSYDYIEARFGFPQIFCGVLFIIMGIIYFLDKKTPIRQRIGMGVLFIILLVSFLEDIVNLFWHAGMEPSGHPYRQAFLWIFIMILCALHGIMSFGEDLKYDLIRLGISLALIVLMFYEVLRPRYDHISKYTIAANYGLLVLYGVLLVLYLLAQKKDRLVCILAAVIALMQLGDLTANAAYTYHYQALNNEPLSDYSERITKNKEAVDYINAHDPGFFRMENLTPRQQNDGLQYGYNSVTHYSSAGMTYVRYFLQKIGFNDDGLYTSYGHDNTALADSLLGIKYLLDDGTYDVHPDYELFYDGDVDVYMNPNALPLAIEVSSYDTDKTDRTIFDLQELVAGRLINEDVDVFKACDVKVTDEVMETGGEADGGGEGDMPVRNYEITPSIDGEVFMYLDGISDLVQGLTVFVDGEVMTTYGNASSMKILNLGYRKAGEAFKVMVTGDHTDAVFGKEIIVTEDMTSLENVIGKIKSKGATVEKISSSHVVITKVMGEGKNRGFWSSIPYEEGWKIKVNGRRCKPVEIYDSLMYIPIDDNITGEVTVDMVFIPKGINIGLLISIISVAVLIFVIFSVIKKEKPDESVG